MLRWECSWEGRLVGKQVETADTNEVFLDRE